MPDTQPPRKALRWLLVITGAVVVFVMSGLLIDWKIAPAFLVIYFGVQWGASAGQKNRRETEAYREEWLDKRKSKPSGDE